MVILVFHLRQAQRIEHLRIIRVPGLHFPRNADGTQRLLALVVIAHQGQPRLDRTVITLPGLLQVF